MTDFLSEALALFDYTRSLRRDFHEHPELGFQEHRTSGIVAKELSAIGLTVTTGIGGTGIVSLIEGAQPGPVVLVRADMDALPITEETNASYSSQYPGVMHACGHDAHMAALITVGRILHTHRKEFSGTVKLVFQPAEEGLGGAERMITEGVLENPKVDFALAFHVWNERPLGWIGISDGPSMAGGEIFKINIIGKGGHGAAPHLAVDPILAAAQIVVSLQSITSRTVPPLQSAVLSVCTIHGGEAFNVIPTSVQMTGTIRTFESEVRMRVLERFVKTVSSVADAMACRAEIDLKQLTPAVLNDARIASIVQKAATNLFPDGQIDNRNYVTMGSEDMAFIMEKVPGCFFFIGSSNEEKKLTASHHHPKFDIDETAISRGVALLAQSVVDLLKLSVYPS